MRKYLVFIALAFAGTACAYNENSQSYFYVTNLAALKSASPAASQFAVREGYATPGDAPPLHYAWKSTCPSGSPDNVALYVQSTVAGYTSSGCWSAAGDKNLWRLENWGGNTASTDVGPIINQMLTAAGNLGQLDVYLGSGVLNVKTTINAVASVYLHGQGGANYGVCGTTLLWNGTSGGTLYSAVVATGALVNPGLSDVCMNGNSLAGTVFNKRGVQWGNFSNLIIYNATQYGVFENVAATPTASDQSTTWKSIQVLCSTGTCWKIGPGTNSWNVSDNFYYDVDTVQSGTAIGFDCGNADGNTFDNLRDQRASGTQYSFIAEAGTSNTPAPNSCRENAFTGNTVFDGGIHVVGNGAYSSFGNQIFHYKTGDGEVMPVVDTNASLIWTTTDTGVFNIGQAVIGQLNLYGREILGNDTGEAWFEVNNLTNYAVAGKFGPSFPLYIFANNPGLGFNIGWNGTNFTYGDGSSSNYGGLLSYSKSAATFTFSATPATGNAGSTASLSNVLLIANSGEITAPSLPTSAGSGGLYVCVDSSGNFYKKSSCP